ncbi:hypothetical protein [Pseudomonas inefficax]|uniref:hypothetical protein n=1 Tax=Pseudomonas inefficax TaxID=2078786 RepID=UPI0040469F48
MESTKNDQPSTPHAEGVTSREGTVVVAYHRAAQCYFRPDTEEFVFLAGMEAGEFENHWRGMQVGISQFHEAQARYRDALDAYLVDSQKGLSALARDKHEIAIDTAEDDVDAQRKAIRQKLGDFSLSGMAYDDVVELLPIVGQEAKGKRGKRPIRYAYVKKSYYDESKKGGKLRTKSLTAKDKKTGQQSIVSKDKRGKTRIDTQKLKQQLLDLEWPKLKLELADVLKWTGSDFDPEGLKKDITLFDWAESWNNSANGTTPLFGSENIDLSGGAQFMRFVSNVGASAEYDPVKGQASVNAQTKASLTIASGTVGIQAHVPDRLGWSLAYAHGDGQTFDMGRMRLLIEPQLSGFIGASVVLESQLQVVVKGDKQMLAGQAGGRLPRFQTRQTKGKVFYQQMDAQDEGLNLSGQAFAGARVEGSLKGSLQWLKPAEPIDPEHWTAGMLISSGEFTDFCTIAPNIAGLAGAGAGGKFHCTFINGKFCFHVAASLCWGAGAKGGLIFEVGTNSILEFGAWLVYQLHRLDYGFFSIVDEEAFGVYSKSCVLGLIGIGFNLHKQYFGLARQLKIVSADLSEMLQKFASDSGRQIVASQQRNTLAENTIARRLELLTYTPESKGILIYLLTRHSKWDVFDPDNRGVGILVDIYQRRKDAVIWVLRSIQTLAEWRKVLCRMTVDGSTLVSGGDEEAIEKKQEQSLVEFLQLGFNRDEDLRKAKDELYFVRGCIRAESNWGYALAMNNTEYYRLNDGVNPNFPDRCSFGVDCNEFDFEWA